MNPKEAAKLLAKVPYLIMKGPLPPLRVVNSIALRGGYDAGMGGALKWKSFELTETDYAVVVAQLKLRIQGLVEVDVPPEVETFQDWADWKLVRKVGAKGAELAMILKKKNELNRQLTTLHSSGKDDEVEAIQIQLIEIATEMSEIVLNSRGK